jgi:hypothetical protein
MELCLAFSVFSCLSGRKPSRLQSRRLHDISVSNLSNPPNPLQSSGSTPSLTFHRYNTLSIVSVAALEKELNEFICRRVAHIALLTQQIHGEFAK